MKQLQSVLMAVLATILLVGCDSKNKVDPRDIFVGAYSFQATGNVDISLSGVKLLSVPLNESGTFYIYKEGEQNNVILTGYNDDTLHAVVSGNQLFFEPTSYTREIGEATIQMTFTYGKGTLVDNLLTWNTDVHADATLSSYSASGVGQVAMVATKNEAN